MPDGLIRARHADFGVADVPDNDYYRDLGWSKVDPSTPTAVEAQRAEEGEAFRAATTWDPAAHNADEVVEYVATVGDDAEKQRVLDAEKAGKARKSVLGA